MDNQTEDLKLEKVGARLFSYCKRGKKKMPIEGNKCKKKRKQVLEQNRI